MVAFVVDVAFCLSLAGLLGMHARMVWLNCTTIEMFEKTRTPSWPYDRGARRNFEEVFGTRCAHDSLQFCFCL
jgi:palmitoyltransferase